MITSLRIKNFRGIRETHDVQLGPFHVLVGPNGSGKSTFLGAVEFVRTCLVQGPRQAVRALAPEFRDLTFMRRGGPIEIDLKLDLTSILGADKGRGLHYRLVVTVDAELGVKVAEETLARDGKHLLGKTATGNDYYRRETGSYKDSFHFGSDRVTLANTPPDQSRYPTGNAVKSFLTSGVKFIQLNGAAMRQPAPATDPTELALDGTNLARVVGRLSRSAETAGDSALEEWTRHLQYAIDDLAAIEWASRPSDNAEYIVLRYENGLECPSWLLSDGTLRMLALTLPAFLAPTPSVYLIEEPENGVHPKALEIIMRSLEAIPDSQVFVATHSPLVVQLAGVDPLLCFSRDDRGIRVIGGPKHVALRAWHGSPELASIYASRVLG